ncbi:MAG: o-succinylbenzoate--CoA ligase [Myxococcota bacterium]
MIATDWLGERARRTPDATAIVHAGRTLSWAELDAQASRHAASLRSEGVVGGERVGLLCGDGPAFAAWVHGIERAGAVLVPLNRRWAAPELDRALAHARVGRLVHDPAHADLAGRLAVPRERRGIASAPAPSTRFDRLRSADDPFAVLFTSGTTGRAKAAELSRGGFFWSAVASAFHLGALPGDRWLACMPLFHVGGLSILTRSVLCGSAVCVHGRFDAEAVDAALDADGITLVSLTATMLQRLLRVRGERPAPAGLRAVLLGGGPCPAPLVERARARGFPVAPTYGLTEACSQVATRPPGAPSEAGLVPLPGTQLRIAADTGHDANAGEVGEILVRGPTLMRAYLHDAQATAQTLRDGWLHTGDLGRLDAEGGLHVVDRRSDLIVSGGENVYPAEVEQVLLAHPAVAEAAVAGVDDAEFGRRPAAWWVLRPGARADAGDLRRFCRERLAGYKVPVAFHRLEALPRDGAGKLLRRRLAPTEGRASGPAPAP